MSYEQYFSEVSDQELPGACTPDVTPPVFTGVSGLVPKNNGAIQVLFGSATDDTNPIDFLIYISLGDVDAATLFQSQNLVEIAPAGCSGTFVFTLGKGVWPNVNSPVFIIKDQEYTFGVRARDAVGNVETNTVVMKTTAIGSVDLATIFQTLQTQFAQDHANFQSDHSDYDTENTQLGVNVTELGLLVEGLQASANALTSSQLQGEIVTDNIIDGSV